METGARFAVTMLIALEQVAESIFFEEKFLNQEINRNDINGGEKMASF